MKYVVLSLIAAVLCFRTLAAPPDASGKWKWIYMREGDPVNIEMDLKQEGPKLSGKIKAGDNIQMEVREGKITDDGGISFFANLERDSGPLKINFSGKLTGDNIKGKVEYTTDEGEKRERDWTPKREGANLAGKWNSSFKRSDGSSMETLLELKQEGQKLTGTQSFNGSETEIRDGKVDGDQVSFKTIRDREGSSVTAKYKGKVAKDKIKGEIESDWTGEVRKLEWEATRAK